MVDKYFYGPLCKGASAFSRIAELQYFIRNCEDSDIKIHLACDGRIGLTFVFLVGSLPLYAHQYHKNLRLMVPPKFLKLLHDINVIDYYQQLNKAYQVTKENLVERPAFVNITSPDEIISFVNDIRMEVPIVLSEQDAELLTSRVAEIYMNSLEHSDAGMVLGGKYFKRQKYKYCFTCYDNGIGIPENVNTFLASVGAERLADRDAIKWALQEGHSTRRSMAPGGVGLALLCEFVHNNGGVLRICSGNTLFVYTPSHANPAKYYPLSHDFDGTLFELDIFSDRISL